MLENDYLYQDFFSLYNVLFYNIIRWYFKDDNRLAIKKMFLLILLKNIL